MFVDVQVFYEEGEYWLLVPRWSFHLFGTGYVRCLMVNHGFLVLWTNVGKFGNMCMYYFHYTMMTMRRLWMQRVRWLTITWNPFVWENKVYYMSQMKLISWWKWFKLVRKLFHFGVNSLCTCWMHCNDVHLFGKQIQWTIGHKIKVVVLNRCLSRGMYRAV